MMISAWWLIPAVLGGAFAGIVAIALVSAGRDDAWPEK